VVAHSGEAALAVVKENPAIDLVLMDVDLGAGWDGTETAERILAVHDLPVVFLSGHTEPEVVEKTERVTSYGYVVKNSNIAVLDASIKMAFKLFDARTALQNTEARQRTLLENSPEVITVIDPDGGIKYTSPNVEKWFGWSPDDEPDRNRWERVHPDDVESSREVFQAVLRGETAVGTGRFRYLCKDGSYKFVEIRVTNRLGDPLIGGLLMSYHDITATKVVEDDLVRQRNLLQSVIDSVSGNIFAKDSDGRYRAINATGARKNGSTVEQMLGKTNFEVLPREKAEEYEKSDVVVLSTGQPVEEEEKVVIDGQEKYFLVRKSLWRDEDGRTLGVIGVSNDVTDWVQAKRRIEGLLTEKELMLREVHHRVKNNMASVAGLLALQASESTDATVVSALEDARSRVTAMMVLYDKLYRGDDFELVPLKDFLASLVDEVAVHSPHGGVTFEARIDDFPLGLHKVQTVGIIVNELLTNALKYAFPGAATGRIVVTAQCVGQTVTVVVQDNGAGIPPSHPGHGFGLRLVTMLSESLDGTVRFENDHGTKVVLEFPGEG